jgi:starch synthase (maltosyl-transferring)
MADFEHFVQSAKEHNLEVALDIAFQCSPDHPYIKEHPEWFLWRPDGSIQFAENPPKKYEDIVPLYFETDSWKELWEELKSVFIFWAKKGVRIFRIDNPHTKPFHFWQWVIGEVRQQYDDAIFLSEAFTRPQVKGRLAKIGFSQSYTYFTWRNSKWELTRYLTELTRSQVRDYLRPNFWPNTPDILPEFLQYGGRSAFLIRLALAATLSSNYGIYGPAFELCVSEAIEGREEYLNSEKYEIKDWDLSKQGNISEFVTMINKIRCENEALQQTNNLEFFDVDNDYLLFFGKFTDDLKNVILVVVNLDPFHTQSGWLHLPLGRLGIDPHQPFLVHDLIADDKVIWQHERNYVELNPRVLPFHIFRLRRRLRREYDFDYYM